MPPRIDHAEGIEVVSRNARTHLQPRDERVQLPKHIQRPRPAPINVHPAQSGSKSSPLSTFQKVSFDAGDDPRAPEVVDVAISDSWPRRGPAPKRQLSRRAASPSIYSRCSTAGQSEISFGILDYYTRDLTPLHSPDLLPPTPKVDEAMKRFDFELKVPNTTALANQETPKAPKFADGDAQTTAGAEREQPATDVSPNLSSKPPTHKKTYSLFPAIKEMPCFPKQSMTSMESRSPASQDGSPTNNIKTVTLYQQPDPSYRPRKESLTGSVRSRKDSFTSFRCSSRKRIPMRIMSSNSTVSGKTCSTASISMSNASPPEHRSRWSDDTITSPTAATTPGPRTSFGSLLAHRDSTQYPACFFEDDDEEAPLRRKFAWKRSGSLTQDRRERLAQAGFSERASFGSRLRAFMLCGGCCISRTRL